MFTSTARFQALLAAVCVALVMSACGHHTNGSAAAQPTTQLDAESLLVSVDNLRQITGVPDLGKMSELGAEPDIHYGKVPAPCRAETDLDVTFGQTWTQFKGFQFGAVEGRPIQVGMQAVGIYPDDTTARTAFTQLLANLQQCSETPWEPFNDLTVEPQDPSNFTTHRGTNYSLYRVRDNVLIMVTTGKFPDNEQVARTIMRTISDRITNA